MSDCKDLLAHLKQFKSSVKDIVPIKEKELQYYKTFTDFLIKYEETNLKKASRDQQSAVALVSDPNKLNMKEKLEGISTSGQNPFKHVKNWVKGEILEIEAML